jgi:hypothetical protein
MNYFVTTAERILEADPRFSKITVGKREWSNVLVLAGTVKTENDKFDAFSAVWTRWPKGWATFWWHHPPAGIFNTICSDEFKWSQVAHRF